MTKTTVAGDNIHGGRGASSVGVHQEQYLKYLKRTISLECFDCIFDTQFPLIPDHFLSLVL